MIMLTVFRHYIPFPQCTVFKIELHGVKRFFLLHYLYMEYFFYKLFILVEQQSLTTYDLEDPTRTSFEQLKFTWMKLTGFAFFI